MSVVDLRLTESGEGRPLMLLHAFPLSSALFDGVRGGLPGWRVLTPDLRGFGGSPLGDDAPSLSEMAGDVEAVLDRLGIDVAVVGGVSMGGYVVMELLRRCPQRLSGVLLMDTKAGADTEQARDGRLAMADAVLEQGRRVLDPLVDGLLGATTRAERPDVVSRVRQWLDMAAPASVSWAQRAMAARPDSLVTLAAAGIPGAVVVGEEDVLSPLGEAQAMAAALGSGVLTVPRTGHLAVLEDPEGAATALRAALDELTGTGGQAV